MGGRYDLQGLPSRDQEPCPGLDESKEVIEAILAREAAALHESGADSTKLMLIGFSQGGALALFTAVHTTVDLAGLVCMSGYLPRPHECAEALTDQKWDLPVLLAHGDADPMVDI